MGQNDERDEGRPGQLTRRGFLTSLGLGAAGVAAAAPLAAAAAKPAEPVDEGLPSHKVTLLVNGRRHRLLVEPRWSLLYVLREKLGLRAAKVGCERGECGACTVLIDGRTRYACQTLAVEAEGQEITTLEGLAAGEGLAPVQRAFLTQDALQCGYCTPGQVLAAEALLRANPSPSLAEIQQGMSGNLCRCGAYGHIFQAVQKAAEIKRGA
jgi:xanthine dehydrogenase YagT iron-sulfur-binding subunit